MKSTDEETCACTPNSLQLCSTRGQATVQIITIFNNEEIERVNGLKNKA
jgi:hypothetical protein